jgi:hypothetical protein
MRTVGFIALALVAVFVLGVVAFIIVSIPDINRYRRVRKM